MDTETLAWMIAIVMIVPASVYWGRWRKNIADAVVDKLCHQYGFTPITSTARKKLYPNTGCIEKETKTHQISFFLKGSLGGTVDIRFKTPLRPKFVILKISPIGPLSSSSSPLTQSMMKDLVRVKTGNATFDQALRLYIKRSTQISHLLTPAVMKKLITAATSNDFFMLTESIISSFAFYHQTLKTVNQVTALAEELSGIK